MPKKGSDWGYQKPWMISGTSNKIWSKNTAELGGVSYRVAHHHEYEAYSGCLTLGWTDISIDDEAWRENGKKTKWQRKMEANRSRDICQKLPLNAIANSHPMST